MSLRILIFTVGMCLSALSSLSGLGETRAAHIYGHNFMPSLRSFDLPDCSMYADTYQHLADCYGKYCHLGAHYSDPNEQANNDACCFMADDARQRAARGEN